MKTHSGLIFRDKNGNLVDINAIASGFLKTDGKGLITSTNDVVIGVKGQEETNYRIGQVNITRDNLGLKEGAIRDVLSMPEVGAIIKAIAGEKGLLIDQDAISMWDGRYTETPNSTYGPDQSNLQYCKLGYFRQPAVLGFKSVGYPQKNLGQLAFYCNNHYFEGVGHEVNEPDIQKSNRSYLRMFWGTVYLAEDKSAYCSFDSGTEGHADNQMSGTSYAVVLGAGKDSTTVGGNSTGVFVYNKTNRGFTLYNDGKAGTHSWLAIQG